MTEFSIKNMVCARCIKTVTGIFQQAGVTPLAVNLGKIRVAGKITLQQEQQLRKELAAEGFEWLDDQKVKRVEEIKQAILQLVHYGELDEMKENLSVYLSSKLFKDYHYLS